MSNDHHASPASVVVVAADLVIWQRLRKREKKQRGREGGREVGDEEETAFSHAAAAATRPFKDGSGVSAEGRAALIGCVRCHLWSRNLALSFEPRAVTGEGTGEWNLRWTCSSVRCDAIIKGLLAAPVWLDLTLC